jgi:hypothetical protein
MKAASTQSDRNMNFDGMESMSPGRSSKHMTNQWSGHMNDGRLVQKAQAPNRVGNDGSCDVPRNLARSVTGDSNRRPMTSATPKLPAQGSIRDNINRGAQVRTPGGTKTMPTCGRDTCGHGCSIEEVGYPRLVAHVPSFFWFVSFYSH